MSALSVFATPPLGGFNSRGAHPEGGTIYGGAETALCELIRGGHAVIRQMEWHFQQYVQSTYQHDPLFDLRDGIAIGPTIQLARSHVTDICMCRLASGKRPARPQPAHRDTQVSHITQQNKPNTLCV